MLEISVVPNVRHWEPGQLEGQSRLVNIPDFAIRANVRSKEVRSRAQELGLKLGSDGECNLEALNEDQEGLDR